MNLLKYIGTENTKVLAKNGNAKIEVTPGQIFEADEAQSKYLSSFYKNLFEIKKINIETQTAVVDSKDIKKNRR